mgnify:CR=1 FL=1
MLLLTVGVITYLELLHVEKKKQHLLGKCNNVLKIAKLRHERANLLGYKTHSHFVLEERMAQNPDKVKSFLNDLLEKAKLAAEREFSELTDFAKELDGIEVLEKWDGAYYSEKLKQKLFSLDDEKLKPYFKLENVKNQVQIDWGLDTF